MSRNLVLVTSLWLLNQPVWAKNASEAVSEMQAVSDTDPNGFKWMVVCIGLLFLVASTLIGATIVYMMKTKKK